MELLYISNFMPYREIKHAGGKTFNFYVENIIKEKEIHVTVVGLCNDYEIPFFKGKRNNFYYISTKGTLWTNIRRILWDMYGKIFKRKIKCASYFKYRKIVDCLEKIKNRGYNPNVIILEWTESLLLIEYIKKIFPSAKYVASEHDVSFLGAKRKYEQASGRKKNKCLNQYRLLKDRELDAIGQCNIVMPQSFKDKELLMNNGVPEKKIFVLAPYFHNMSHLKRSECPNCDILFWGAMYRKENYEAAIWFIEEVMPLLSELNLRFVIAGNRPPRKLVDMASEKVIVTGFVEDETVYFENSMCFVSPLLTGAGIKVKIIEALSMGIPVLTNDIGIEGIPAIDGISYLHCTSPEDYAEVIKKIYYKELNIDELEQKEKELVHQYFNLENSYSNYKTMLQNIYRIKEQ